MSRPANIYELLDDDSNAQKGPVTQQKPKTQTTQPKGNSSFALVIVC